MQLCMVQLCMVQLCIDLTELCIDAAVLVWCSCILI